MLAYPAEGRTHRLRARFDRHPGPVGRRRVGLLPLTSPRTARTDEDRRSSRRPRRPALGRGALAAVASVWQPERAPASPVRVCWHGQAKQPARAHVAGCAGPGSTTRHRSRQALRASVCPIGDSGRPPSSQGPTRGRRGAQTVEGAGERTVRFGFLCPARAFIRYALEGDPTSHTERHGRTFADMLAAPRRALGRAESRAQRHRHSSGSAPGAASG
jgi:hypothetical protein